MNCFMQNDRSDDRIMADAILGAVAEGDGHMFTPAEIDWALTVTGDISVAEKSMMGEN